MAEDSCDLLCLDLPAAETLRLQRPNTDDVGELAEILGAFADPTRLTIALTLAAADELCVCDLSWVVGRAQNLVSHHLRILRALELAEYRRDGKLALYSLTSEGMKLLDALSALRAPREVGYV